jgi:hypothetical protein
MPRRGCVPALQWLATTAGQCTEAAYPYTSGGGNTGKCKTACKGVVKVTGGVEVATKNETALLAAIASVPLSLSVDASSNGWQLYAGGVYTAACKCNKLACLDHAVGGVGYGTDPKSGDFYIVRNSWSAGWGENGYIRLARGDKYGPEGQVSMHSCRAHVAWANSRFPTPALRSAPLAFPPPAVRRAAGLAVGHRLQLGALKASASMPRAKGAQHTRTHTRSAGHSPLKSSLREGWRRRGWMRDTREPRWQAGGTAGSSPLAAAKLRAARRDSESESARALRRRPATCARKEFFAGETAHKLMHAGLCAYTRRVSHCCANHFRHETCTRRDNSPCSPQ